mgnify:CR=1 FL=1
MHDVDTLRYIIGSDIAQVAGMTNSFGLGNDQIEDSAMVVYKFENGVLATSHESFVVNHNVTTLEVHGTKASIYIENAMTQDPIAKVFMRDSSGYREIDIEDRENMYIKAVRQFADSVKGTGRPFADGNDGFRSLQGALTVLESVKTKKVIEL